MTAQLRFKRSATYFCGYDDHSGNLSEKLMFAGSDFIADAYEHATDYAAARWLAERRIVAPVLHEENGFVVKEYTFSGEQLGFAEEILLLQATKQAAEHDAETYRAERDQARRKLDYMWFIVAALAGTVLAFSYFTWFH